MFESRNRLKPWLTSALLSRLLFSLFLLPISTAYAAVQGTTGANSSGNVDISLTTGLRARIGGLADFALGTATGTAEVSANDNICIGRTGVGFFGTGPYRILASGDGEPGDPSSFTLYNGADRIYYEAYYNDQTGLTGRQQLTHGVMLTGQTGPGFGMILNYIFGCVANNANLSIVVPVANQVGPAGSYTGTLTLTLIPD